jgi:hypothetical protein
VTAEGVLSKLRGIYVPNYDYQSASTQVGNATDRFMIGIARTVVQVNTTALTNGSSLQLKSGGMIYLRDQDPSGLFGDTDHETTSSIYFIQISPNADFSSPYTAGTHYKIQFQSGSNPLVPYVIKWINATASASTIYIRYRVIDRFVYPKIESDPVSAAKRQDFFYCNRREYNDLMYSSVSSASGSTLTPSDTAMYIQGIHDSTEGISGSPGTDVSNYEYITITWPDASEKTLRISSINRSTGVITFAGVGAVSQPTHPTLGTYADSTCSIRVSTTDYYTTFHNKFYYFMGHNASPNDYYYPEVFDILPSVGQVVPKRGINALISPSTVTDIRHWRTGWSTRPWHVYNGALINPQEGLQVLTSLSQNNIKLSTPFYANRIEEAIKAIICDGYYGYGVFRNSLVTTENSGILTKPFSSGGKYLDEIIKDIASQSFPANMFIKDKANGEVLIKRYSQKTSYDYMIPGVASVTVEDPAEKITSVTIISKSEEDKDITPSCFAGGGFNDATKMFDGNTTTYAYSIRSGTGVNAGSSLAIFQLNPPNTNYVFPFLKEISIYGYGTLFVGIFYGRPDQLNETGYSIYPTALIPNGVVAVEGYSNIILSQNSPATIPGDALNKYIVNGKTCVLVLRLRGNSLNTTINGVLGDYYLLNEVNILVNNEYAHTASMSDNSSLASNSNLNSSGFGTSWSVKDPSRAVSFRYAPTSWVKRNASNYGGRIEDIYVLSPGTLNSGSTSIASSTPSLGENAAFISSRSPTGGIYRPEIAVDQSGSGIYFNSTSRYRGYGFTTYPIFTITPSSGSPSVTADIIQHRSKVLRMDNISQLECRKYAESYMDEYLRTQTTYTVQAPLLDYAEPGDTVLVQLPDGSQKTLLLWGISDSGSALDNTATYTLRDYSL